MLIVDTPCHTKAELFFSSNRMEVRKAKELCWGCPRIDPCQVDGWQHEYGVWGGLSAVDRKRIDPERYREAVAMVEEYSVEVDLHILRGRIEAEELDLREAA